MNSASLGKMDVLRGVSRHQEKVRKLAVAAEEEEVASEVQEAAEAKEVEAEVV